MSDKIFVSGLYSQKVNDNAPSFVLGKLSMNVEQFKKWLDDNKHHADDNGYIRMTIMKSRDGEKRYIELDTWKPETKDDGSAGLPQEARGR